MSPDHHTKTVDGWGLGRACADYLCLLNDGDSDTWLLQSSHAEGEDGLMWKDSCEHILFASTVVGSNTEYQVFIFRKKGGVELHSLVHGLLKLYWSDDNG